MSERTDERIDELIAFAALGELSNDDQLELDALLAEDVELAGESDAAMETAAILQGAHAEAPPAQLKASVLGAIATTSQVAAFPRPNADDQVVSDAVDARGGAESAPVVDLAARRRRRLVPILSAAAAVVVFAGVAVVVVGNDSGSGDDPIADPIENGTVVEVDPIDEVVGAGDAVSRDLVGQLDGTLMVVHSSAEDALVIDGDGLEVLGEDREFVLWLVAEDGATRVQGFRPDASGDVRERVDGVDPSDFVLGVTEEQTGGVDQPTLPILASA